MLKIYLTKDAASGLEYIYKYEHIVRSNSTKITSTDPNIKFIENEDVYYKDFYTSYKKYTVDEHDHIVVSGYVFTLR